MNNDPIAISHSERVQPRTESHDIIDDAIDRSNVALIIGDVRAELEQARALFPRFNSAHEGWAVIQEELDELWQEVKANKGGTAVAYNAGPMYQEAKQVAAMAIRFMLDICHNT